MREKMIPLIGNEWLTAIDPIYLQCAIDAINYTKKDARSTPDIDTAFKIFREIKPEDVKVIICSQCPYPNGKSDGIAFSCSLQDKITPTMSSIYESILEDEGIPEGEQNKYVVPEDLTYLVKQGVFLCNMKLTVSFDDPTSHSNIGWEQFMLGVFKTVKRLNPSVPICLWGAQAVTYYKRPLTHLKANYLTESHPVAAARNHTLWLCNHFSEVNKQFQIPIRWIKQIPKVQVTN